MATRSRAFRWLWALALVCLACAPTVPPTAPPAPPAAAPGGASAPAAPADAPLTPLSVRVVHSAIAGSQALLQVLEDGGLYARHGLAVELTNVAGRTATAGLLAGEYPLVITSGTEVVNSGLAGGDAVIVAAGLNTLDTSIWTRDAREPADLRGKPIGITQIGDSTDFAARYAARRWGLDTTSDLQILQVGQPPERLAALEAGVVAATILQPPLTTRARKSGLYKLVEIASLGLEYQHTVAITTRRRLADDPEPVARFVRAWAEGLYFYRANPDLARAAVGKFMRLEDPEALEETYAHYSALYAVPPYPTLRGLQTIIDITTETDDRARGARPEDFVDTRILDALQSAGRFEAWSQQYRPAP